MFLHVSVILFTGRGMMSLPVWSHVSMFLPGEGVGVGAMVRGGGVHPIGMHPWLNTNFPQTYYSDTFLLVNKL